MAALCLPLLLALLGAAGRPLAAVEERPKLVFLPLEDQTGDAAAAAAVEEGLRAELGRDCDLVEPTALRDALRRWRVRDRRRIPPGLLEKLAAELGASRFFSATLYEATADPVPRVTLAGQVLEAGRSTLAWAGFVSASGLDRKGWLGLGEVRELETLLAESSRRLTGDFLGGSAAGRRTARAARRVFLRQAPPAARPPTMAVVPFDAATGPDAAGAGEEITDLALAVLWRHGFPLASPGAVEEALRRREVLARGAADEATREAIRSGSGAEVLFTGTVEEYDFLRQAPEPEPRVAFFARLLDGASGRILWMGGKERHGWDHQRLFGRGRIHAAGRLAEVMMDSLIASFSAAQGGNHG